MWIPIALNAVTIVVLVFTWLAATAQAKAAKSQADAAEKLIIVTEAQRRTAEDSVRAAKEQSTLIKAQLEEALRTVPVYEEGDGILRHLLPCTLTIKERALPWT